MANAIAALSDIHEASLAQPDSQETNGTGDNENSPSPPPSAKPNSHLFIIDQPTLAKLLVALNECSEWGRIAILSTLARYRSVDPEESERICERVVPQFQHVNAAVVLGAVKVGRDSLLPYPEEVFHVEFGSQNIGYHDTYEERPERGLDQVAHTENGSSTRYVPILLRPNPGNELMKQSPSFPPLQRFNGLLSETLISFSKSDQTYSPTK